MGVIMSGILSKVSGKVAGVVGASWKDKAYLRAWVKPANPQTPSQVLQREKFERCVSFAKPLVGQVFNAYTDRFRKNMSGFNYFIKRNLAYFTPTPDYPSVDLTEGPLSYVSVTSVKYSGTTIVCQFSPNYGNNGDPDDKVFGAAYHKPSGTWYFPAAEVVRSAGVIDIVPGTGFTASDFECWYWPAQYTGAVVTMIADSWYQQASTP